jgi:hypothetical protein
MSGILICALHKDTYSTLSSQKFYQAMLLSLCLKKKKKEWTGSVETWGRKHKEFKNLPHGFLSVKNN